MTYTSHALLAVALQAIGKAEAIAQTIYRGDIAVELKKDETPVTIADREIEKTIRAIVSGAFPDHGFLGEEFGSTMSPTGYTWVIDPIDGTKNYARHIPLYGILLALMKDGEFQLGVSSCPALHERMYATKGEQAFLNDKPVRVSETSQLSNAYITFGGLDAFNTIQKMDGVQKIIQACGRTRAIGDAYAYHLVASGKFDAVVEAKVSMWDIAAPAAIIEAAGGRVTDIFGKPIGPKTTTIIASNGKIHEELIQLLN